MASSHQVTQLLFVPPSNLLIGFCTDFTVKTQVEWEFMKMSGKLSSCCWQNRLWMHEGGGKLILSSLDPSNFAAWWLRSPVALWWAQDGSVSTFPQGDVPRVSFHHLLHRRSENHSLVFWKGLISGRESSFFPFFSVLICYR